MRRSGTEHLFILLLYLFLVNRCFGIRPGITAPCMHLLLIKRSKISDGFNNIIRICYSNIDTCLRCFQLIPWRCMTGDNRSPGC